MRYFSEYRCVRVTWELHPSLAVPEHFYDSVLHDFYGVHGSSCNKSCLNTIQMRRFVEVWARRRIHAAARRRCGRYVLIPHGEIKQFESDWRMSRDRFQATEMEGGICRLTLACKTRIGGDGDETRRNRPRNHRIWSPPENPEQYVPGWQPRLVFFSSHPTLSSRLYFLSLLPSLCPNISSRSSAHPFHSLTNHIRSTT